MNKKGDFILGLCILFFCILGVLYLNLKTNVDNDVEKAERDRYLNLIYPAISGKLPINKANYCENMLYGEIDKEINENEKFYESEFKFRECVVDNVRYVNKTANGVIVRMRIYKNNKEALSLINEYLSDSKNYKKDNNTTYYFSQTDDFDTWRGGSAIFPRMIITLKDNEYVIPIKN